MICIGVTQRVDVAQGTQERRDCLDQKWTEFLASVGILPVLIPNLSKDISRIAESMKLEGFLLTGGNDLSHLPGASQAAPERDALEANILTYAGSARIPVLGVCRGFQMLNHFHGGKLRRVDGHIAVRHAVQFTSTRLGAERIVNSYHSWGLEPGDLGKDLEALALAKDGTVEAAGHRTLPFIGIMWHPEREAQWDTDDQRLFRNFFKGGGV